MFLLLFSGVACRYAAMLQHGSNFDKICDFSAHRNMSLIIICGFIFINYFLILCEEIRVKKIFLNFFYKLSFHYHYKFSYHCWMSKAKMYLTRLSQLSWNLFRYAVKFSLKVSYGRRKATAYVRNLATIQYTSIGNSNYFGQSVVMTSQCQYTWVSATLHTARVCALCSTHMFVID